VRARKLFPTAFFMMLLTVPSLLNAACINESQDRINMQKLLAQLPQPKRKILDSTLKQAEKQNRALLDRKLELETQTDDLLAAPAFDKPSYLDKSARLGTLRAKMNANMDDAIAEVAAQFSPQERIVLMKMRQLWHTHGYHKEWSRDDEEDNHQPAAE
jgi:uncharacterized membrane protein